MTSLSEKTKITIKTYQSLLNLKIILVKNKNFRQADKIVFESKRIIQTCLEIIELQSKIDELSNFVKMDDEL